MSVVGAKHSLLGFRHSVDIRASFFVMPEEPASLTMACMQLDNAGTLFLSLPIED
jgi:hypothetical protein